MSQRLHVQAHTRPQVTAILTLPVGNLHDPPGKEGLAYLTGQMLLRGAGDWDRAGFADELDFLGAWLAVGVGRDTTTLSGDSLTRNLDRWQALITAAMVAPHFCPDELAKLKRQTLAELAQLRDQDTLLGQRFFVRRLFGAHRYGLPLKGNNASIAAISVDDVRAFHARYYRASDALVGVSGDMDASRLDVFEAETVGRLPPGRCETPEIGVLEQGCGYRVLLVDKPERTQTQVFIGQHAVHSNHASYLPLWVANTLFGGTFTARLSHEIREKRGWSYGAYSYLHADRRLGTFMMRFYPSHADTVPALQLADVLFRELVAGVEAETVDKAIHYLRNSHCFSIDTADKRLQELVSSHLNGRPANDVDTLPARIAQVTLNDVNQALAAHLVPDDLTVVIVCTASELLPALEAWDRVASIDLIDYRSA